MKRICVFAGSSTGNDPAFAEHAEILGKEMRKRDIDLVYGGSRIGLMGRIADTVIAGGGKVAGVMPTDLFMSEMRHMDISEFFETQGMHERKAKMYELSDAFIALPGGYGTYEEIFEVVSWAQIGIHEKPIGLLNVNGFYDPLVEMIKRTIVSGFIQSPNLGLLIVESDPVVLLDRLASYERPSLK